MSHLEERTVRRAALWIVATPRVAGLRAVRLRGRLAPTCAGWTVWSRRRRRRRARPSGRTVTGEVPGRPRRARRGGGVDRAHPAPRPPVPVLAGLLLDAVPTAVTLLGVRLRGVRPGDRRRRGRRRGHGPGPRPAARRHRPHAARPAGRPRLRRLQGRAPCGSARFTLLTLPVEEYPELPALPERVRHHRRRRLRRRGRPGRGRRRARRHAAGPHRRPGRDRGRAVTLVATDRYRLAVRELTWRPDDAATRRGRAGPGPHPGRHRQDAGHRRRGGASRWPAAAGDSCSGSPPAAGAPRPGSSTASSPSTARCSRPRPPRSPVETAALVEAVKRVALVGRAQHPGPAHFTEDAGRARGRQRRGRPGLRGARGSRSTGPAIAIGFNPGYLLDGLQASTRRSPSSSFTQPPKPAVIRAPTAPTADSRGYRTCSCLPASMPRHGWSTADRLGTGPSRGDHDEEDIACNIGLVGLGKMGGNMRERLRAPGTRWSATTATPRSRDVDVPRGAGRGAAAPRVRCG